MLCLLDLLIVCFENRVGRFRFHDRHCHKFFGQSGGRLYESGRLYKGYDIFAGIKAPIKKPESGEDGEVPVPDTFESIRFEGVSYRYGNDQEYVLKDISFCINAGEQIGLVGLNGAGKTTLTLLLCGLLKPTGGKIFYNGIDIEQFSRKEYISLFSNVFQDINLLHFTIGENITGSSDGETWKRAETVLKTAGFERNLGERGTAASIGKTFDERGIDFSGGEKQKLAIARALYKNTAIFILDEPTSAMDPLAEERFVRNYKEIFSNRTSIFISHRLLNTKISLIGSC